MYINLVYFLSDEQNLPCDDMYVFIQLGSYKTCAFGRTLDLQYNLIITEIEYLLQRRK